MIKLSGVELKWAIQPSLQLSYLYHWHSLENEEITQWLYAVIHPEQEVSLTKGTCVHMSHYYFLLCSSLPYTWTI